MSNPELDRFLRGAKAADSVADWACWLVFGAAFASSWGVLDAFRNLFDVHTPWLVMLALFRLAVTVAMWILFAEAWRAHCYVRDRDTFNRGLRAATKPRRDPR